jgi:hypothetical protein
MCLFLPGLADFFGTRICPPWSRGGGGLPGPSGLDPPARAELALDKTERKELLASADCSAYSLRRRVGQEHSPKPRPDLFNAAACSWRCLFPAFFASPGQERLGFGASWGVDLEAALFSCPWRTKQHR